MEITRPFYPGVYPVTQAEYEKVMGNNPSHFNEEQAGQDTSRFPVETVSWHNAMAFCKKLNTGEKRSRKKQKYTLPTEAQWEYACRGPAALKTSSVFHFGDSLSSTQANFDGNPPYGETAEGPYLERPCDVGSYKPNAFGLHDMHGQVWEWCQDWYDENFYTQSPHKAPAGPTTGTHRVLRGSSWCSNGHCCRAAYRFNDDPGWRDTNGGIRVLLLPQDS